MASDAGSSFDAALASLTLFESTYEGVEILSALLNQDYDAAGTLSDVVDVGFRLRGRPGVFSVHPPFEENWIAIAFFRIGLKQAMVEGIYQGLASAAELPAGPIGPPIPMPGTAVPV